MSVDIDSELWIEGCEVCPLRNIDDECTHPSAPVDADIPPDLTIGSSPSWCPLRHKPLELNLVRNRREQP